MNSASAIADRPLILTGADRRFARTLWQFLRSAERGGQVEGNDWVAYDLGMTPEQHETLARRFPWCAFRRFEHERWPDHVRVDRGTYAWKPVIIHTASLDRQGPVFWLDSATLIRDGLEEPIDIIRRNGVVSLRGRTPVVENADPRTFAALGFPVELWTERERVGGVFGFDTRHPVARDLVRRWFEIALDEPTIAPAGADRSHNYDQTVLSCLLIEAAAAGRLRLEPNFDVDISLPRPMRWITTRNKVDPRLPTWADPLSRAWYRVYKTVDQAMHRWNAFLDGPVDGLRRVFKENFTVHLMDLSSGVKKPVRGPRFGYWADPFVREIDGRRWLFAEEYMGAADRGRLVAMVVRPDLSTGPAVPVIDAASHRSFPFLFEIDGVLHMIPESSADRTVDLFRCEGAPNRWKRVRRLFWDVGMVDTVAFQHQSKWWLIGSRQPPEGGHPHLAVWSCDDLRSAPLVAHPIGEARLYGDATCGTGRNAGPVVEHDGRLLRVMQRSSRHYGEGGAVMEIVELDAEHYREVPFSGDHPIAEIVAKTSPHHVCRHGGLVAWDVRDRARNWP